MNNIPLPQDTRLYYTDGTSILEPRVSIESFSDSSANGSYDDLKNSKMLFALSSQSTDEIKTYINDKNVSSTRSGLYYGLNGFDQGFEFRFINYSSPTVCFLPEINATDSNIDGEGVNVNLVSTGGGYYTIANYSLYLSNQLSIGDLILLKTQTNANQNLIYRVYEINEPNITVYDDSSDSYYSTGSPSVNLALSQNQDYIFVRAKINDRYGVSYYGLYNTSGNQWASQTAGIKQNNADYGIILSSELNSNTLNANLFLTSGLSPQLNQIIAINVNSSGGGVTGGKSSGTYIITKISNGLIYIEPDYQPYVFIHQFVKVDQNITSGTQNETWYVDPETTQGSNYVYGSVNFRFLVYAQPSASDPSEWALQVGGANDNIVGFPLYTEEYNDSSIIKHSDIFSFSIKPPTWSSGKVIGLSIEANYSTNAITVQEEVVIS